METVTCFHVKEGVLLATGDMVYETVGTDTSEERARKLYNKPVKAHENSKFFLIKTQETVIARSDK